MKVEVAVLGLNKPTVSVDVKKTLQQLQSELTTNLLPFDSP